MPTPRLCTLMRQLMHCIVPMQASDLRIAFFVRISVAIILKECEIGIGTGIDMNLRNLLRLACVLDVRTSGNDRTRADKERNGIDGRVDGDRLATVYPLIRPV